MIAHHASDALFQHFDQAHLGEHCEEIGADDIMAELDKHFTAEELYAIALDEYKKAGRHVGQEEKIGLTQWAYWSAERDDFHTEEEVREELRAFPDEDMVDQQG